MAGRLRNRLLEPGTRVLLGFVVSAVFVVLFLRGTDFGAVADAFREANVVLILLGIAAYFAGVWFRAARWHYLFMPVRPIPARQLFPIVAIGYATNNILPARTGEVIRAHVFGQRFGVSPLAGLGSVAMERLFDGLLLTFFLCVGVAASLVGVFGMAYAGDVLAAAMVFLVFGVSVAFLLSYRIARYPRTTGRTIRRLLRRLPGLRSLDHRWVDTFISGLGALRRRRLATAALWTSAVAWGFEALTYWLVGEGCGLDLAFPVYLLTAAAANIIITAPSTSGGIGPFEWAVKSVVLIFASGEGAEEVAIAYAAALHGLVLVPITIVGLCFLWILHVPIRRHVRVGMGTDDEAAAEPVTPPRNS